MDIGGGTADVVVFHGGAVMHTRSLPIGGNHLTADVAAGLRTPIAEAEQLKINYGVATNQWSDVTRLCRCPESAGANRG